MVVFPDNLLGEITAWYRLRVEDLSSKESLCTVQAVGRFCVQSTRSGSSQIRLEWS